jgi:hypothetical protein
MITPLYNREVEKLDELLAVLAASPAVESRLVESHAQFARSYKLGAMPGEYEATLEMARGAAARIPDGAVRARVKEMIQDLISALHAP